MNEQGTTTEPVAEAAPIDKPRDSARIAAQNDLFRNSLGSTSLLNGMVIATAGVVARGERFHAEAMQAVAGFSVFTEDNDPHGERDFGAFEIDGVRLFWKIDLYDPDLRYGSEDPANPKATHRVLTVMLASEY